MGIPYAFQYYYNKYNCENELMIDFHRLAILNINYLFFDYNSLIHPCAQQILSANHDKYILIENLYERTNIIEKDIIQNCLNYTRLLINQVLQTKQNEEIRYVYITIDGVAPRSKMNQQRERRYKSEFFKSGDVNKSCLWDSNKITPGTSFMNKIKDSLYDFVNELKDTLNIECVISDSNDIGEGEHKIMKLITNIKDDARVCIYGLDADLIMLSLMNKNHDKIILIRDNSFNNNLSENKKVIDYLNISNLKKYICNDISSLLEKYKKVNSKNLDTDNIIYDYILVCFLLGNDFLEHIPSLSIKKHGIDIIMRAYVNAWKGFHLINKSYINDKNRWYYAINLHYLKDLMFHLKNSETYFFNNFKLDTLVLSEVSNYETLSQSEKIKFYKDDFIRFKDDDNYKSRYYMYYGIKSNNINKLCLNYIEGLYWIFGYYNDHIHENWSWFFEYHNSPFCSDIFEFLRKTPFDDIINCMKKSSNLKKSHTYTPIKQLYMVLPKSSLRNILIDMGYNIDNLEYSLFLYDKFYPDKISVDVYNKKYLWQTKIFFENINEDVIDLFLY
jgi:5'-3' exoribonuclease 1